MFKRLISMGFALGASVLMAEQLRAPDRPGPGGVEPVVVSAAAADTQLIPNPNGDVTLRISNAEACEVTIVTPNTEGGNAIEDKKIAIGAGKTKVVANLDPAIYNNKKGQLEVKTTKDATKIEITRP